MTERVAVRRSHTLFDMAAALCIFAIARLLSAWFLTMAARAQPDLTDDSFWHVESARPQSPGYWQILSNWDGQWFQTIVLRGYSDLGIGENALAFAPGYPYLVRFVMDLTGLAFEVSGSLVSMSASAVAIVVLFQWLSTTRNRPTAFVAVTVLSFFPAAPILQAVYSDGLALLWTVLCVRAAVERRTVLLLTAGLGLAYTRPVVLAVAAFVFLLALRRRDEKRSLTTGFALVLIGFAWPVTAGFIAGDLRAYMTSNAAWQVDGEVLGGWMSGLAARGLTPIAYSIAGLVFALLVLRWRRRHESPPTKDWIGSWAAVYLLFILATAPPSAGIVRHAILTLVPLGVIGPMSMTISGKRRLALLSAVIFAEIGLQWLWVRYVFVVENPMSARIP